LTKRGKNSRLSLFPSPNQIQASTKKSTRPAHTLGRGDDLLERDLRVLAPEVVVLGKEQHAMALLALAHGDAGTVPEALGGVESAFF